LSLLLAGLTELARWQGLTWPLAAWTTTLTGLWEKLERAAARTLSAALTLTGYARLARDPTRGHTRLSLYRNVDEDPLVILAATVVKRD
jgi:hypothetical protein